MQFRSGLEGRQYLLTSNSVTSAACTALAKRVAFARIFYERTKEPQLHVHVQDVSPLTETPSSPGYPRLSTIARLSAAVADVRTSGHTDLLEEHERLSRISIQQNDISDWVIDRPAIPAALISNDVTAIRFKLERRGEKSTHGHVWAVYALETLLFLCLDKFSSETATRDTPLDRVKDGRLASPPTKRPMRTTSTASQTEAIRNITPLDDASVIHEAFKRARIAYETAISSRSVVGLRQGAVHEAVREVERADYRARHDAIVLTESIDAIVRLISKP